MYGSAAVVTLIAAGVAGYGLTTSATLAPPAPAAPSTSDAADRPDLSNTERPASEDHANPLSRRLLGELAAVAPRRPLYDPPPPPPPREEVVQRSPTKPMTVKLIGTIIEAGNSMAVFTAQNGQIEVRKVGENVEDVGGDVRVTAIKPYKVTVEYAGASRELTVEPPAKNGLVLNTDAPTANR